MNWNSLKIFLSIARTGSLSAAANELDINHSTVFRRLHAFEKEIGGRLFERLNNRYELSTLGHELFDIAQGIENSFDDLDRRIVGKDFQPKGVVKITAPNNIAYRYLPGYILAFNQIYPDIQIELLASNQTVNMSSRQADIAVRATSAPPDYLIGRRLHRLNWSFVGSRQYEKQFGFPARPGDLKTHALIGAVGNIRSLPAFSWLDKHFYDRVITRCDDLIAMSYFAESGQGLALLPDDQLRPETIKLFTFEESITSDLWLLTHPDLRNVERIRLVMQHLTQCFSEEWGSL